MTSLTDLSIAFRELAEAAARSVGPMLVDAFRGDIGIDLKQDFHDFVTVHDRAAEERIREVILERYPQSVIIGEEDGTHGVGHLVWYVDPIDGTSNFARGIAFWCVSIAAAVDGEIVAGVVFDPIHGDLYRADVTGAWLNDMPLSARGQSRHEGATILTHFPMPADLTADSEYSLERYGELVGEYAAVRNLSSGALCLAHVAAGWADGTFNFGTNAWDVAAGAFILRQAGGLYRGYHGGQRWPQDSDYLAPDYVGTVADADFKLIDDILRGGRSLRRPDQMDRVPPAERVAAQPEPSSG